MKKVILSLCLLGLTLTASAQEKFRIGVTGGMNVSTPTNQDTKMGYNVGLRGEWNFKGCESNSPFLSFGLLLTDKSWRKKGWHFDYSESSSEIIGAYPSLLKAHPTYLELPLHFGYRWAVGKNVNLFASAGPYVAFGLFGKDKYQEEWKGQTHKAPSRNVFDDELRRFDWGIGYRVGVELKKHYQISISQDWGLRNMRDNKYADKLQNRNCSLNFGYTF